MTPYSEARQAVLKGLQEEREKLAERYSSLTGRMSYLVDDFSTKIGTLIAEQQPHRNLLGAVENLPELRAAICRIPPAGGYIVVSRFFAKVVDLKTERKKGTQLIRDLEKKLDADLRTLYEHLRYLGKSLQMFGQQVQEAYRSGFISETDVRAVEEPLRVLAAPLKLKDASAITSSTLTPLTQGPAMGNLLAAAQQCVTSLKAYSPKLSFQRLAAASHELVRLLEQDALDEQTTKCDYFATLEGKVLQWTTYSLEHKRVEETSERDASYLAFLTQQRDTLFTSLQEKGLETLVSVLGVLGEQGFLSENEQISLRAFLESKYRTPAILSAEERKKLVEDKQLCYLILHEDYGLTKRDWERLEHAVIGDAIHRTGNTLREVTNTPITQALIRANPELFLLHADELTRYGRLLQQTLQEIRAHALDQDARFNIHQSPQFFASFDALRTTKRTLDALVAPPPVGETDQLQALKERLSAEGLDADMIVAITRYGLRFGGRYRKGRRFRISPDNFMKNMRRHVPDLDERLLERTRRQLIHEGVLRDEGYGCYLNEHPREIPHNTLRELLRYNDEHPPTADENNSSE